MQLAQNKNITEIVRSITRLSNLVDLTKSQYPYLPLTFSVWRKEKYEQLKQLSQSFDLKCLTIEFHNQIDKNLLYLFMAKVKEGIKDSFKALRSSSADKLKQFKEQNQYQSLIVQYIEAATGQLYRLQILSDLLTFPYGVPVTESYYLRKQFTSQQQINNNGIIGNLINKHSKTVVSKGLSALGNQIWSRVAILMIGGMNIFGFASGVVISQAVDLAFSRMGKSKRILKLQTEITQFNQSSLVLEGCIRTVTLLTDQYIQSDEHEVKQQIIKQFYKQLSKVFVFEPEESIVITDVQKGWKFVDINREDEDESFEVIEKQENQ